MAYQLAHTSGPMAREIQGSSFRELKIVQNGEVNMEGVISRPEDIKIVFWDSSRHKKAVANDSGFLMLQLLGDCLGLISKQEWSGLQKVVEPSFRASTSNSYLPFNRQSTKQFLETLLPQGHDKPSQYALNPLEDLKMLPFRIVTNIIYRKLDKEISRLESLIPLRESLWNHMIAGGVIRYRWSRYLPLETNKKLRAWKEQWESFNNHAASKARYLYEKSNGETQKPTILDLYSAIEKRQISFPQALQTIDEMLFANLDVTMGGISWNLVFLAENGAAQDKLKAEIDSLQNVHRGTFRSVPEDWIPDAYNISSKTFLHACILESARLRPLAAFSVPQSAPTSRIVVRGEGSCGYLIPPNTNFVIDSHALNIHNHYWGSSREERETYCPERFLQQKGTELRYNYWRFGFGPRQCLGKHVADLIIKQALIQLLSNYKILRQILGSKLEVNLDSGSWITHPDVLLRLEKK
ncbi:hypothetical protein HYALB_00011997 [Hymenoscyphus albidus]|uniref:Cytochrome P450 monooxygenase n=1 Tax=Hymenoscyphus albidus TaxID=595503 RepID=A0A9N9Q698_9HELO|nr:hypothetical protein HYALB_00011997 [Hymenoscyphus albidus]